MTGSVRFFIDGVAVTMSNRYPTADAAGIGSAINVDYVTFTSVVGITVVFRVAAASTPANCQFTYAASVAGASPAISTPVTSGC